MGQLADIRDGIKDRLDTISGLYAYDNWPNRISQFPAALVMPDSKSRKLAMGGHREIAFNITVLGGATRDLPRAQDILDPLCDDTGASSIIAALEGDKTLGGVATTLDVAWRDYGGELEFGGAQFITVTFDVTVWP